MSPFVGLEIITFVPNFRTPNPTLMVMVAGTCFVVFTFFWHICVMKKSEKIDWLEIIRIEIPIRLIRIQIKTSDRDGLIFNWFATIKEIENFLRIGSVWLGLARTQTLDWLEIPRHEFISEAFTREVSLKLVMQASLKFASQTCGQAEIFLLEANLPQSCMANLRQACCKMLCYLGSFIQILSISYFISL